MVNPFIFAQSIVEIDKMILEAANALHLRRLVSASVVTYGSYGHI